jgi:excisionase family DNA binding protein
MINFCQHRYAQLPDWARGSAPPRQVCPSEAFPPDYRWRPLLDVHPTPKPPPAPASKALAPINKAPPSEAAISEPLVLSLSEAAKVLGIGVSTAYRLCSRGEFPVPVLRIGGTVKVSTKRLSLYVNGDIDAVELGRS